MRWPQTILMILTVFLIAGVSSADTSEPPQDPTKQIDALAWKTLGETVDIAGKASLKLSGDLKFVMPPDSSKFLQLEGNPPQENNYILSKNGYGWFAVFNYDDSGHIKDDENLDPDALLDSLKKLDAEQAAIRQKQGLPKLTLVGWFIRPHYDKDTHRLEWATKLMDDQNSTQVNYSIRILARRGVMNAMLVSDPTSLERDLKEFKLALSGMNFNPGEHYTEVQSGDKIAAYGLGALVVGGAAAVAAKSGFGLLKIFGAGIAALFASIVAFFRNFFKKKT